MKNTGLEGKYIIKDNKKLQFGYTTGSCAAAAAKAATQMLFSQERVLQVDLKTPKGIWLHLEPQEVRMEALCASCAIQKEAGDDPDVTQGLLIFASARRCSRPEAIACQRVFSPSDAESDDSVIVGLCAGEGVGTVTLPGLEQPIGAPAINRVPRSMIIREVREVCEQYQYTGGIQIKIWVPHGEAVAQRTFNPRLGILGGISILGTSGIVEPMSEKALIRSIELEMKQKTFGGRKYLLVTPGNYGTQYLKDNFPFPADQAVKCSNFVGATIDFAVNLQLEGMLFVAHIGKFVKVAGGIMNTHSHDADARMEILVSCALRAGADAETARKILECVTTDEGLRVLEQTDLLEASMKILMQKIDFYLQHRSGGRMMTGAIVFSNVFGELGRTKHADLLIKKLKE